MEKGYILVTGASRGLGKAIAIDLAGSVEGLVLHFNRGDSEVKEVAESCRNKGSKVETVRANLQDVSGIDELVSFVKSKGIELSGLVNNAGIGGGGDLREVSEEAWDRVQSVNIKSPVLLTQKLLPFLSKGSAVVNISSAAGIKGGISSISYEASKAALIHATRSMALSLSPDIRVNSVAPGFVKTDINRAGWEDPEFEKKVAKRTPAGRWGRPEDIAAAVSFLLSSRASFITGETLVVDGGITIR